MDQEDLGDEPITDEGLTIRRATCDDGSRLIREVGHFDYVIYEYRHRPFHQDARASQDSIKIFSIEEPGVAFIAERLADLETRCAAEGSGESSSIDRARWKWNLKAAKRRLRRLVQAEGMPFVEVAPHLRELVQRVVDEGPEASLEFDAAALNKLLWEEGRIDDVREYERRKAERVVVVMSELPSALRSLLGDANEAYFHGLHRATVALCRAVLEDVLRRVAKVCRLETGPVPISDERLDVLINCIPGDLMNSKERSAAHAIRKRGNEALHDSDACFSEDDTWNLITTTGILVGRLVNRLGNDMLGNQ